MESLTGPVFPTDVFPDSVLGPVPFDSAIDDDGRSALRQSLSSGSVSPLGTAPPGLPSSAKLAAIIAVSTIGSNDVSVFAGDDSIASKSLVGACPSFGPLDGETALATAMVLPGAPLGRAVAFPPPPVTRGPVAFPPPTPDPFRSSATLPSDPLPNDGVASDGGLNASIMLTSVCPAIPSRLRLIT